MYENLPPLQQRFQAVNINCHTPLLSYVCAVEPSPVVFTLDGLRSTHPHSNKHTIFKMNSRGERRPPSSSRCSHHPRIPHRRLTRRKRTPQSTDRHSVRALGVRARPFQMAVPSAGCRVRRAARQRHTQFLTQLAGGPKEAGYGPNIPLSLSLSIELGGAPCRCSAPLSLSSPSLSSTEAGNQALRCRVNTPACLPPRAEHPRVAQRKCG